jgi:hypothetical protein
MYVQYVKYMHIVDFDLQDAASEWSDKKYHAAYIDETVYCTQHVCMYVCMYVCV